MHWSSVVAVLFVTVSRARSSAPPCRCSPLLPAGLKVDCSFSNLTELFVLPPDTTELLVQGNRLTSLAPGLLDKLVRLEKVSLSGNPFHCDCRIQYLRSWLLKNMAVVSQQPTCAGPSPVARRDISQLSDDYFGSCATAKSPCGTLNAVSSAAVCLLVALLVLSLRLAKASTITLYIDRKHPGLEAMSLRPPRPKRGRRADSHLSSDRSSDYAEDLEKPRVSVELLPQVLDTLHRRHNIRITVPEEPRYARRWTPRNAASGKEK